MIDWSATAAMMQGWAACVVAGAAAVTAYAGVAALTAWRRQFIGQRRAALAEEILAMGYEAVDRIRSARVNFQRLDDVRLHRPVETDSSAEAFMRDVLHAPGARLKAAGDLWSRLEAARFRARAFFGERAYEAIGEIVGIRRQIEGSSLFLGVTFDPASPPNPQHEEMRRDIWAEPENDKMTGRLADALTVLEATCSPALSERRP